MTDGAKINRSIHLLQVSTALLFLCGIAVAVVVYFLARSNTRALCALRGDLEQRVATSQKFLREHPNGVAGIPAITIRQSITNQQRTINALSNLNCR